MDALKKREILLIIKFFFTKLKLNVDIASLSILDNMT